MSTSKFLTVLNKVKKNKGIKNYDIDELKKNAVPVFNLDVTAIKQAIEEKKDLPGFKTKGEGNFGVIVLDKKTNLVYKMWKGKEVDVGEVIANEKIKDKLNKMKSDSITKIRGSISKALFKQHEKDYEKYNFLSMVHTGRFVKFNDGSFGMESDAAEHGSLDRLLKDLAHSSSNVSNKTENFIDVKAAFDADPADFLSTIATTTRNGLLITHDKSQHLHFDLAARNFLVFTFSDQDFKIDPVTNKIVGIKDIPVKIADLGLAQEIKSNDEIVNTDKYGAIRWMQKDLLIADENDERKASVMSDIYSWKATMISNIGLALGQLDENYLLRFAPDERIPEFKERLKHATDDEALTAFLNNAITLSQKVIKDENTQNRAVMKKEAIEESDRKIKIAQGCLAFIKGYGDYLSHIVVDDKTKTPIQLYEEDTKRFQKAFKEFTELKAKGYPINYDEIQPRPTTFKDPLPATASLSTSPSVQTALPQDANSPYSQTPPQQSKQEESPYGQTPLPSKEEKPASTQQITTKVDEEAPVQENQESPYDQTPRPG